MSDHNDRKDRENDREKRRTRDLDYITETQARNIAESVFDKKIKEIFKSLGIEDVTIFDQSKKLGEDFSYLRKSRESSNARSNNIQNSAITSIVGSIIGLIFSILIFAFTHK